jgi:DNA replication protein DnaC
VALGQAACRAGKRVRFCTAAALVNQLEEAQKQYRLERLLAALGKVDLLIVDELGYLSFSRSGRSCCSRCSPTATSGAAS